MPYLEKKGGERLLSRTGSSLVAGDVEEQPPLLEKKRACAGNQAKGVPGTKSEKKIKNKEEQLVTCHTMPNQQMDHGVRTYTLFYTGS